VTDQRAADGVDEAAQARTDEADGVGDVDRPAAAGDDDAGGAPDGHRRRRRVNRWDRPPQPRDWRFYVGGTGKVLIATGLLIFGFVAYQLWGTGIETARAQKQLENEFEELLVEFAGPDAPATADPADVDTGVTADDGAGSDGSGSGSETVVDDVSTGEPVPDAEPVDDPAAGADAGGEPTAEPDATAAAVPVAVDLTDDAVVQDSIPQPSRGDPLLRLEIPKIGRDDIVVPGVALDDLKDGPGHYPDTPLPGQLGNAAIAGHRTTYGAPFFDVDRLAAGDEIITTLLNGDRFVYEVTDVEVVGATDYQVVTTTNPNIAELTLTSCHPKYTARDRIVVHSVLNPAKSSNVGVPTFYTLDAESDAEPIPGDDPVLTVPAADGATEPAADAVGVGEIEVTPPADAPTTPDAATDDARVDDGAADPVDGTPATDTDPAETDTAAGASPAGAGTTEAPTPIDAFEEGWFDDAAAFPQIGLWALMLTLVSVIAYQVAKRFRRVWVGVMLGIVPFVVALYFFYQNVNRLLPAGI